MPRDWEILCLLASIEITIKFLMGPHVVCLMGGHALKPGVIGSGFDGDWSTPSCK